MSVKQTHSKVPVIPAILSAARDYFDKELAFGRIVGAVHIDVIDNKFVTGQALSVEKWPDKLEVDYAEAHLMVERPTEYLAIIAAKGISRAIVHIESQFDMVDLRNKARELDILLGFAVNPETDLLRLKPVLDTNTYIQVMGVHPGSANQRMIDQTALGVSYIRKTTSRQVVITVDGGINIDNVERLRQSGADYFISSHAIFAGGDYQENYDRLSATLREKELV